MQNLVLIQNNQTLTTSKMVAEAFEKPHRDVLKSIYNLDCTPDFHERNFSLMLIPSKIGNGATRQDKAYNITRDGFTFLAMGFTGKRAAEFKEAYIKAFNEMEQKLRASQVQETKYSIEDLIIAQATSMKELRAELEQVKSQISAPVAPVELQMATPAQTDLFPTEAKLTVKEFTTAKGIHVSHNAKVGYFAKIYSDRNNLKVENSPAGHKYCIEALEKASASLKPAGTVMVYTDPEAQRILEQLKKNPLAQELKVIPLGESKHYRANQSSILKNLIGGKIHKVSPLRFSISCKSRGWVKITRVA